MYPIAGIRARYTFDTFLAKQCDAALIIVNIFDAFERIPSKIKQEFGEIAKRIAEEGGTARNCTAT